MRIFSALVLLFSVNAFACPTLTGAYTCTYQDNTSEVITIAQEDKAGIAVYNYNGSTIPADNQAYKVPDDVNLKEGSFRAWCDDKDAGLLQTQLIGKYFQQGSYYGDLTLNMTFSLVGADLHQVTVGKLVNTTSETPLNAEITCVRNK